MLGIQFLLYPPFVFRNQLITNSCHFIAYIHFLSPTHLFRGGNPQFQFGVFQSFLSLHLSSTVPLPYHPPYNSQEALCKIQICPYFFLQLKLYTSFLLSMRKSILLSLVYKTLFRLSPRLSAYSSSCPSLLFTFQQH